MKTDTSHKSNNPGRGSCDKAIWTKQKTFELIAAFRANRDLWDTNAEQHNNYAFKNTLREQIAQRLGVPVSEVASKLHNLRCQFNAVVRWMKQQPTTADQPPPEPKWIFYRSMQFLATGGAGGGVSGGGTSEASSYGDYSIAVVGHQDIVDNDEDEDSTTAMTDIKQDDDEDVELDDCHEAEDDDDVDWSPAAAKRPKRDSKSRLAVYSSVNDDDSTAAAADNDIVSTRPAKSLSRTSAASCTASTSAAAIGNIVVHDPHILNKLLNKQAPSTKIVYIQAPSTPSSSPLSTSKPSTTTAMKEQHPVVATPPDSQQIFGNYVADQLRSLPLARQKQLKLLIQKQVIQVLEDENWANEFN